MIFVLLLQVESLTKIFIASDSLSKMQSIYLQIILKQMMTVEEIKKLLPYPRYSDEELEEAIRLLENLANIYIDLEEEN